MVGVWIAMRPISDMGAALPKRLLLNWIVCWLLLPNAGFMLLWLVGSPPRYPEILAGGAVGLLVRQSTVAFKLSAFALLLIYNSLSFVSALFNLSVGSLLTSIGFVGEMRLESSIEYRVCASVLLLTLALSARVMRLPTQFTGASAVAVALVVTVSFAALDAWMSFGTRGAYKRSAPNGSPFESAVARSGFVRHADGKRHLILVMVESMGEPVRRAARAQLTRRWFKPDVQHSYDVTTGTTAFFGSTTNGEVRALCGRWGDYDALLDHPDANCLPALLQKAGYDTTAMHSFEGSFFDRDNWYPNVGFNRRMFRDELFAEGASGCPGVFPGACDRDVPQIITRQLQSKRQPQFVYWLTVNSHLPVPTSEELKTTECAADQPMDVRRYAMICRQFTLWDQIQDGLASEMTRPDFPNADVLIVGDHMPPYFDRAQRSEFNATRVPWILLRRKPRQRPPATERHAKLVSAAPSLQSHEKLQDR